ncbi:hypothetical protein ACFTSF_27735 [Kribbella sp. NPDC056951]|uniref:hypothetical protein n=1 Tax=Kribbella sp. NPDC056951 TaxID=3345978 RepID=UPI00363FEA8F
MTDTESRLRDYLDTKAATVPTTAQGPGLLTDTSPRRPLWPILATAASVAAVLALTVTVLTHLGPDKPTPASPPAPRMEGLPFTIIDPQGKGTLHDGDRTVKRPADVSSISARVGDGWIASYDKDATYGLAILKADGTYRPIGPVWADSPVVSPDGKQIAMVVRDKRGDDSGRLAVFDVATGAQVTAVELPKYRTSLSGWNSTGIWIDSHDFGPPWKQELRVWQPGAPAAQEVPVGKGFSSVTTRADTATVVVTQETGDGHCYRAGSLQDGRLKIEREHCNRQVEAAYPVVSTDGRSMLNSSAKLIIDIPSGKTTKLQLPEPIIVWPKPVFENATKVQVVTQAKGNDANKQSLYRCDVTTGACKLLRTEKKGYQIVLALP